MDGITVLQLWIGLLNTAMDRITVLHLWMWLVYYSYVWDYCITVLTLWILSVHHRLVLCYFIQISWWHGYRQIPAKCISISIYISKNTLFLSSAIEQISTYPSRISAVFQMVSYTCGGVSFIMAWWTNPFGETRQIRVIQKCAVLTSFLQVVFKILCSSFCYIIQQMI